MRINFRTCPIRLPEFCNSLLSRNRFQTITMLALSAIAIFLITRNRCQFFNWKKPSPDRDPELDHLSRPVNPRKLPLSEIMPTPLTLPVGSIDRGVAEVFQACRQFIDIDFFNMLEGLLGKSCTFHENHRENFDRAISYCDLLLRGTTNHHRHGRDSINRQLLIQNLPLLQTKEGIETLIAAVQQEIPGARQLVECVRYGVEKGALVTAFLPPNGYFLDFEGERIEGHDFSSEAACLERAQIARAVETHIVKTMEAIQEACKGKGVAVVVKPQLFLKEENYSKEFLVAFLRTLREHLHPQPKALKLAMKQNPKWQFSVLHRELMDSFRDLTFRSTGEASAEVIIQAMSKESKWLDPKVSHGLDRFHLLASFCYSENRIYQIPTADGEIVFCDLLGAFIERLPVKHPVFAQLWIRLTSLGDDLVTRGFITGYDSASREVRFSEAFVARKDHSFSPMVFSKGLSLPSLPAIEDRPRISGEMVLASGDAQGGALSRPLPEVTLASVQTALEKIAPESTAQPQEFGDHVGLQSENQDAAEMAAWLGKEDLALTTLSPRELAFIEQHITYRMRSPEEKARIAAEIYHHLYPLVESCQTGVEPMAVEVFSDYNGNTIEVVAVDGRLVFYSVKPYAYKGYRVEIDGHGNVCYFRAQDYQDVQNMQEVQEGEAEHRYELGVFSFMDLLEANVQNVANYFRGSFLDVLVDGFSACSQLLRERERKGPLKTPEKRALLTWGSAPATSGSRELDSLGPLYNSVIASQDSYFTLRFFSEKDGVSLIVEKGSAGRGMMGGTASRELKILKRPGEREGLLHVRITKSNCNDMGSDLSETNYSLELGEDGMIKIFEGDKHSEMESWGWGFFFGDDGSWGGCSDDDAHTWKPCELEVAQDLFYLSKCFITIQNLINSPHTYVLEKGSDKRHPSRITNRYGNPIPHAVLSRKMDLKQGTTGCQLIFMRESGVEKGHIESPINGFYADRGDQRFLERGSGPIALLE